MVYAQTRVSTSVLLKLAGGAEFSLSTSSTANTAGNDIRQNIGYCNRSLLWPLQDLCCSERFPATMHMLRGRELLAMAPCNKSLPAARCSGQSMLQSILRAVLMWQLSLALWLVSMPWKERMLTLNKATNPSSSVATPTSLPHCITGLDCQSLLK